MSPITPYPTPRLEEDHTPNLEARSHIDLVNSHFTAQEPDELWLSDIT